MGGFSSGRTRVRVEDGLILNLGRLLRQGSIIPGKHVMGSLKWTSTGTKGVRASIGYEADLTHPGESYVRLHYNVGSKPMDYRVWLRRAPCRFGGFRWWWRCPRTEQNAAKLYLPPGATMFASRHAYRMGYKSWGGGPLDRSHIRQRRIYEKLGGTYRQYGQSPPKRPKGMHHRTYARLLAELDAAKEAHDNAFMAGALPVLLKFPEIRARLCGRV
jgi:hypothetical protein